MNSKFVSFESVEVCNVTPDSEKFYQLYKNGNSIHLVFSESHLKKCYDTLIKSGLISINEFLD